MWRRHVTVYITTMSAFFAPAHAARVPIALLSTITSTISTNVAPRHVSCVAPEHVDTRVGAVDIRLSWPRNLLTTTVWAEAASPSNNHQKYFYHLLSWILVYSWPGCLNISYHVYGWCLHTMRISLWSPSHLLLKFSGENVPDICNMPIWIYSW